MKISTKGRYGVRVLLELALNQNGEPTMMSTIAKNQGISRKYLHSLLTSLKAAGIVRSVRGAGGGYLLIQNPADIQVSNVLLALEGPLTPVDCVGDADFCERADLCVTREVWTKLSEAIHDLLSAITIEQLVTRHKVLQEQNLMYNI